MHEYLHNISELICLLVALFYYPYIKKSFMKWFLPFILFIFLGEIGAKYLRDGSGISNVSIYYIIGIVETIFYGYIFRQLYTRKTIKRLIDYFIICSVTAYVYCIIFYREGYAYYIPVLISSGFFLALIALVYIYTKFVDDEETFLISEPGFWIAFGVSIFFSGTCIVFSLHDYIVENNLTVFGVKLYNFVARVLSVVLYSSISIAIILCKKKSRILL